MPDDSQVGQLPTEDFGQHDDKLRAWARSLDTTPERLKDIMLRGGSGAKQLSELLGLQ